MVECRVTVSTYFGPAPWREQPYALAANPSLDQLVVGNSHLRSIERKLKPSLRR
jgi:hypothetical protein